MSKQDYDKGYLAGLKDANQIVQKQIPDIARENSGMMFIFQPLVDAAEEIQQLYKYVKINGK